MRLAASEIFILHHGIILRTTGVDFDKRCQKYRVRLTRNGIVYLIAYTTSLNSACRIRRDALKKFNASEPFDYLHSYETSSRKKKIEGDDYLFKLGLSDDSYKSSPYRSLLVATLMQAIKDRLSTEDEVKDEAKQWFESKSRDTLQFSFLDLCDELSIKPNKVKQLIKSSEHKPSRRVVGRRLVRSSKPVDKRKKKI